MDLLLSPFSILILLYNENKLNGNVQNKADLNIKCKLKKTVKNNGNKNLTNVNKISEVYLKEITDVIQEIFPYIILEMIC